MASISGKKKRQDSAESDASFLSDIEEMKLQATNELLFVDSYFVQDQSIKEFTNPILNNAINSYEDSATDGDDFPWNRLKHWIHCFCVVTFDLEIGQMIEVTFLYNFVKESAQLS